MAGGIRLDKYLVEMAVGSRSQIKEAAKKGRIRVNGEIEKRTEKKIDPQKDQVFVDGVEISYVKTEYYMLNKPQGVVSATWDNLHKTVLDLLEDKKRKDLFPVGRLDIDTEGLLLITNDGDLAYRLLSPKRHVDKVYDAKVSGTLPEDAREQFKRGIVLTDGTPTLPAHLEILKTEEALSELLSEIRLTIHEGKFHQVKRMFEAIGCKVVYLKRISMGSLVLDDKLSPGQYRPLTEDEVQKLQEETGC